MGEARETLSKARAALAGAIEGIAGILRLESDNRRLQERIDEEQDQAQRMTQDNKELTQLLADLRSKAPRSEDELVSLKNQLAKEQKLSQELQSRLDGFVVSVKRA